MRDAWGPPASLAALETLDKWAKEAVVVVNSLVDMEKTFVTADFFRLIQGRRVQAAARQGAHQSAGGPPGRGRGPVTPRAGQQDRLPCPSMTGHESDDSSAGESTTPTIAQRLSPRAAVPELMRLKEDVDRNSGTNFMVGFLDKKAKPERGEAYHWQRRWFVCSTESRMLYYMPSPSSLPKPRVSIVLTDVIVEDVTVNMIHELAESLQKGMTDAAGQSLVFRLRSIEQNRPVVKGHTQLILRASTLVEKENWLTRLRQVQTMDAVRSLARESSVPRRGDRPPSPPRINDLKIRGFGGLHLEGRTRTGQIAGVGAMNGSTHPRRVASEGSLDQLQGQLPHIKKETEKPPFPSNPALPPHLGGNGWRGGFGPDNTSFLSQMAADGRAYCRVVLDTLASSVSKAVIHIMVMKAEGHLQDSLYGRIAELAPEEQKRLTQEDPSVVQRRAALALAVDDVVGAIRLLRTAEDEYSKQPREVRGATIHVPRAAEIAGQGPDLINRLRPHGVQLARLPEPEDFAERAPDQPRPAAHPQAHHRREDGSSVSVRPRRPAPTPVPH